MTPEELKAFQQSVQFLQGALVRMTGGPRVLVVEDDPDDVFIIQRELSKFVCSVEYARDGNEAVDKINKGTYDYILMDQLVPKLTGLEILQKTAGLRKDARVIIVTGFSESPCIPEIMKQGAVMAFAKPIQFETLRALGLMPLHNGT